MSLSLTTASAAASSISTWVSYHTISIWLITFLTSPFSSMIMMVVSGKVVQHIQSFLSMVMMSLLTDTYTPLVETVFEPAEGHVSATIPVVKIHWKQVLHFLEDWTQRVIHFIESRPAFQDAHWIQSPEARIIAVILSLLAVIISFIHIYQHLRLFTMPWIQIYVIRILFICPIYAVASSLAMFLGEYGAVYVESIRDLYEAIVIYAFFNLILEYGGGETDCIYAIENDAPMTLPCPLCCLKKRPRDARLIRFCHRGVLQFIITKLIMTFSTILLLPLGLYLHPIYQLLQTCIYNISYGWALYCLYVFYLAVKEVISPFHPMAKFATIKAVIFATYYQTLILQICLVRRETYWLWNNFLLTLEMMLFSILCLWITFPTKEFLGGIPSSSLRHVCENLREVCSIQDVYWNLVHHFHPSISNRYRDYALQRSEGEVSATLPHAIQSSLGIVAGDGQGVERVHSYMMRGNMDEVAMEMMTRYRGYNSRRERHVRLRGNRLISAKIRRDLGREREREREGERDREREGKREKSRKLNSGGGGLRKESEKGSRESDWMTTIESEI